MEDRGHLTTELSNPHSRYFDRLTTTQAVDLMNREDSTIAEAIGRARLDIAAAVELVVEAFQRGGRLVYVGAGTSGRLATLDAAECPPTFLTDPETVQAIIAGGTPALTRSIEGAEDRFDDGAAAVYERGICERDVVLGIATGGTTPFVHGALSRARQLGAKTIFFACVDKEQVDDEADVSIRVLTGPEVLTGSTRLKAGTATKMVLNMVTTIAMTRIGKVYRNLMIDVNVSANAKLVDRGTRIVQKVTGLSRDESANLLSAAHGRVKTALVMHARGVSREQAQQLLAESKGGMAMLLDEVEIAERGT